MKLCYVRVAPSEQTNFEGGSILDDRVIEALSRLGADVEVEVVPRKRLLTLPFWLSSIPEVTIDRVRAAKKDGRMILVSHEAIFHIAFSASVDCLILHNYFAEFSFRGRPSVEKFFRSGSFGYYRKCFAATKSVFFISYRESRIVLNRFPNLAGRTDVCPPPPFDFPLGPRSKSVLHMSGSESWYPKRLSMLNDSEKERIRRAGFEIRDFRSPVVPSLALINDRFEVGFKLKLTQMLRCRDVIASFCDLSEEINNICSHNPFYRQVENVDDAIGFFSQVFSDHSFSDIDAYYASLEERNFLPNWCDFARSIISLMQRENLREVRNI